VQSPIGWYWREAPVAEEKLKNVAAFWDTVGKMTKEYGIQTALHSGFLSPRHRAEAIRDLFELTNTEPVGLGVDTASAAGSFWRATAALTRSRA
jgi:hypothetical protein